VDNIWAMVFVMVWTVYNQNCSVYNSCAQWYPHTWQHFLNVHVDLGLSFFRAFYLGLQFCVFCRLTWYNIFSPCICCVSFVSLTLTMGLDGNNASEISYILYQIGHKILTQSIICFSQGGNMFIYVGHMFNCSWKSQFHGSWLWEWQHRSVSWRCYERKVSLLIIVYC